ncbi:hypothetical protein MITS9508_01914 [Synechococcus sp. MIT S9508]|nr:hypothetical protein MITS9508_01914 [Synechococcus sp. MIT S9508]
MKTIRRLAAATASGALLTMGAFIGIEVLNPANSSAGETWIVVWREYSPPKPGTMGEEMGWYGTIAWVDAKSILRRGDMVYYNIAFDFLKAGGVTESGPVNGSGRETNCRKKLSNGPRGWEPFGDGWNAAAARFACNF